MKISFERSYRSTNGNTTFVYSVKGNESDLSAFKKAQGEFYRENENGQALWFTTRYCGDSADLIITTNGKIVPDMSAFDKASSLAAQYGGDFGQQLAMAAAQNIIGAGGNAPQAPAPQTPTQESAEGLDKV